MDGGQSRELLARIPQDDVSKHDVFFLLKLTPVMSVFLALVIIYAAFIDPHVGGAPGLILVCGALIVFMTVLTEWDYYAVMKAAAPVNLRPSGVEFEPPVLHKGFFVGKGRFISKDQIVKIEIARDKARANGLATGSLPTETISAFVIYTREGKKVPINNNHPGDLLNVASVIRDMWGVPLIDPNISVAPGALPTGGILANNPTRRPTMGVIKFLGLASAFITVLFIFPFLDIVRGSYDWYDVFMCIGFGFAYASFLALFLLIWARNIGIKSVGIQKDGINIHFHNRIELYRWGDIGGVTIIPSDRFKTVEERYALLALRGKPWPYIITVDVGRAIEAAYMENTGRMSPPAVRD